MYNSLSLFIIIIGFFLNFLLAGRLRFSDPEEILSKFYGGEGNARGDTTEGGEAANRCAEMLFWKNPKYFE